MENISKCGISIKEFLASVEESIIEIKVIGVNC